MPKEGIMIDRHTLVRWVGRAVLVVLAVAVLVPFTTGYAHAQPGTGVRCETVVTFENRTRRVFGTSIAAECGDEAIHTAPFGNWGVNSNGGRKRNGFQFPGWHTECTFGLYCNLRQWNSCTARFPAPNPRYYNDNNYTTQRANPDSTAVYGHEPYVLGSFGETCESQGRVFSVSGNYMELWELDGFPNPGDDKVAKLIYPRINIPIICGSEWDCTGSSAWFSPSRGADAVSADIRITVRKYKVICESPETGECF